MKPISVFEHERIESLSEVEKSALDKLLGPRSEQMFDLDRREVQATSFVGVVQLGPRSVQVLPKMHRAGLPASECERHATANLLFLLSYTGKLRVTGPEISQLTERPTPLSEILYWIFARQLWEVVRRELLRGYDPIPLLALLRQGVYDRAFVTEDHSPGTSVMTKRATVHSRCRTFTGQTRRIMGCGRRKRSQRRIGLPSFPLFSSVQLLIC